MRFVIKSASKGGYLICNDPEVALAATKPSELRELLGQVEQLQTEGYTVAGWLSYEAACGFDDRFRVHEGQDFPLAVMLASRSVEVADLPELSYPELSHPELHCLPRIKQAEYAARYDQLIELIHSGDLYQANFSFRTSVETVEDGYELFCHLESQHPMPYASFVEFEQWQVVCSSPELFLRKQDQVICSEPMKGTAPRGLWFEQDEKNREFLETDEKNRAENLMIVDLMRNDLSKICEPGSVTVPSLFESKRFPSLHQMVSQVEGSLLPDLTLFETLKATFPAGSITGTPKFRAMEVINDLEIDARKAYTGSIGVFLPNGDFELNVAIRTVVIDTESGGAELGIGSGVVSSSSRHAEWQECLLKGEFLNYSAGFGEIFETILWSDDYHWLDEHIERLARSCHYFLVPFDEQQVRSKLELLTDQFAASHNRVRLAISRKGIISVTSQPLNTLGWDKATLKVRLMDSAVDASSPYQYHKTDHREHYDTAYAEAVAAGFSEALFLNEQGFLAEGAITNIFVLVDGRWLTPSIESGILPGIWRGKAMQQLEACPSLIDMDMLVAAEKIVIGNSLRFENEVSEIWSAETLVWSKKISE